MFNEAYYPVHPAGPLAISTFVTGARDGSARVANLSRFWCFDLWGAENGSLMRCNISDTYYLFFQWIYRRNCYPHFELKDFEHFCRVWLRWLQWFLDVLPMGKMCPGGWDGLHASCMFIFRNDYIPISGGCIMMSRNPNAASVLSDLFWTCFWEPGTFEKGLGWSTWEPQNFAAIFHGRWSWITHCPPCDILISKKTPSDIWFKVEGSLGVFWFTQYLLTTNEYIYIYGLRT